MKRQEAREIVSYKCYIEQALNSLYSWVPLGSKILLMFALQCEPLGKKHLSLQTSIHTFSKFIYSFRNTWTFQMFKYLIRKGSLRHEWRCRAHSDGEKNGQISQHLTFIIKIKGQSKHFSLSSLSTSFKHHIRDSKALARTTRNSEQSREQRYSLASNHESASLCYNLINMPL